MADANYIRTLTPEKINLLEEKIQRYLKNDPVRAIYNCGEGQCKSTYRAE